jgi:hypothetical protein
MDTAYYAAGAVQIARGGGLFEPFLWNYLDDSPALPHLGFLYWMPLPSLLAAPLAVFFPGSFFALQLPFVVLSSLLPVVALGLAWEVARSRRCAWLAGLLVVFSGLFFPYWTLPETFAPFALFGSLALWMAAREVRRLMEHREAGRGNCHFLLPCACGGLVGLAHLTRADGVLLLLPALLAPLLSCPSGHRRPHTRITQCASRNTHHASCISQYASRSLLLHASLIILGYLLVMAPWFLRNLSAIGRPLSPAGTATLWLRSYEDLFCYQCDLSLRSYLSWGGSNILRSKLWAASVNLGRFLAEDCLVFLLPFILLGSYRLRRRPPIPVALAYLLLVYVTHSLAFTFPGPRGGFFHASSPVLPFLFAAAAEGLDAAIAWAAPRRRWNLQQAKVLFGGAAVMLAASIGVYAASVQVPAWQRVDRVYEEVDRWLVERGAAQGNVMVANPPAFWYYTGRPAVVVPSGGVDDLLAAVERYGVRYVLLDQNRPTPLAALYAGDVCHPRLRPVVVWGDAAERVILYSVE